MNSIAIILIAIFAWTLPRESIAQETKKISFPKWVTIVSPYFQEFENFGDVAANNLLASASIQRAQAQSFSLPNPNIQVGIGGLSTSLDPREIPMTQAPSVSIKQLIPNRRAAKKAAESLTYSAKKFTHQAESSRQIYAKTAAESALMYSFLSGKRDILVEQKKLFAELQNSLEARYAYGRIEAFDLNAIQVESGLIEVKIENVRVSQASISGRWQSIFTSPIAVIEKNIILNSDPFSNIEDESMLEEIAIRSPQNQVFNNKIAHSEKAASAKKAAGGMNWNIGLSYGLRWDGRSDLLGANIGATLPVWNGKTSNKQSNALLIQAEAAKAMQIASLSQTRAALSTIAKKIRSHRSQIGILQKLVIPNAQRAVASAQSAYETGNESITTFVMAANNLLVVRLQLLRTATDLHLSEAKWLAVAGLF